MSREPLEAKGNECGEEGEGPKRGRSRARDRRHQHQVGDCGHQGNLESGFRLAEVFGLPSSELNQTTDPVLDHHPLAVTLSESLGLLLSAQTPERVRLGRDLQRARRPRALRTLSA